MTPTTDKELLELAARAAGIAFIRSRLDDPIHRDILTDCTARNVGQKVGPWNPLTDDGDALRLAVRLGLFWTPEFSHFLGLERFAAQEHDDCYAHRRAIVRAAAAMAVSRGEKTE